MIYASYTYTYAYAYDKLCERGRGNVLCSSVPVGSVEFSQNTEFGFWGNESSMERSFRNECLSGG